MPAAYLRLARAHNCLAAALMPLLGAYLALGDRPRLTGPAGRAALVTALLVAACNAYNDLRDVPVDRENAPTRPLPSRAISLGQARTFAALAAASGLLVATSLGMRCLVATLIAAALGALYSRALKSTVLIGNAIVGALSGFTIVFGAMAVGRISVAAVGAGTVTALFVFFREILKTAADHEGDLTGGVTTISTRYGRHNAIDAACFVAAAFVVAGFAIGPAAQASQVYLPAFGLVHALPVCALIFALRVDRGPARLRVVLRVSKALWFAAPVSLAFLRG